MKDQTFYVQLYDTLVQPCSAIRVESAKKVQKFLRKNKKILNFKEKFSFIRHLNKLLNSAKFNLSMIKKWNQTRVSSKFL